MLIDLTPTLLWNTDLRLNLVSLHLSASLPDAGVVTYICCTCVSLFSFIVILQERRFCTTSNPITLHYFRFEWQLVWECVATQKFSYRSWRCPGSTSLPASQSASGRGRTDIWCCCCAWWGTCSCSWIPPPLCWTLQRWCSFLNPDIPCYSLGECNIIVDYIYLYYASWYYWPCNSLCKKQNKQKQKKQTIPWESASHHCVIWPSMID